VRGVSSCPRQFLYNLQTPLSLPGLTLLESLWVCRNQSMALRCHRAGTVHSIICRPNSASGIHRNTFPIGCTTRHTAAISKKPLSLCDWCCNSNKYHACRNDGCGKNEICRLLNQYGIVLGQCGPKCQPTESRRLSSVSPCGLSVASPGASFHGLGASGRTFSPQ
jgi:hypothetical protein